MIGGVNQTGFQLSQVYSQTNQQLADVMGRIASGKKIQTPSDDFSGYVRANSLSGQVADYERIKQDLMETQSYSKKAVEVGTAVYEDLVELKDIAEDYNAASDDDERKALAAEFLALRDSVVNLINNNTDVYNTSTIATVDLDPGTAANNFVVNFGSQAVATADVAALTSANGGALTTPQSLPTSFNATELAAIDSQIQTATRFLVSAENMDKGIGRQVDITSTVIQTQKSVIAEIQDVDDIEEMAKQTDLQIRQQAAVAMMAQANASQQGMMRLFL